jgi:hypothetical protein
MAQIAMTACKWCGVAIETASIDWSSSILLYLSQSLTHDAIVDIAERRNLDVGERSVRGDVVLAAAAQAHNTDADTIVGADYAPT